MKSGSRSLKDATASNLARNSGVAEHEQAMGSQGATQFRHFDGSETWLRVQTKASWLLGVALFFWAAAGAARAQRFPPNPKPQIEISTSQPVVMVNSIRHRPVLSVNLTLKPGEVKAADIYVLLSIGINGRDPLAIGPQGQYAKRILPYASGAVIAEVTRSIDIPIFSYLPSGTNTLTAMMVKPQADPLIESNRLASATTSFAVVRPAAPPIEITEQGSTWLSKELFPQPKLQAWDRIYILPYGVGNLYVNYKVPLWRTQKYPIVFIHGEAVTGAGYEMALDGEGWATFFLKRGFPVFTTDWPSVGRSAFAGKENHDKVLTNTKIADDVAELLDRLGPAILVTKSWAGTVGWKVADMRPHLVRGIVALTPRVLGSKPSYRLPVAFDANGTATRFYPTNPEEIDSSGNPEFTGSFLHNAPELQPRTWIEQLSPGWYDREIGIDDLYTYVDGPGRVPISRGIRDQLQVPMTAVGSPDRPTKDVTFKNTKILVLIGESDPTKSPESGRKLVAALKAAGVAEAHFEALTAENGFAREGFDLEYGINSGRIAKLAFDWMVRTGLAKETRAQD